MWLPWLMCLLLVDGVWSYDTMQLSARRPEVPAVGFARTRAGLLGITTIVFTFTGAPQNFTVPVGITDIIVEMYGASGGDSDYFGVAQATGGNGGMIRATVAVTPGEVLSVYIGAMGSSFCPGSYNGGGQGGGYTPSGCGGGASDIRRAPYAFTDRLVVAGGGGGSFALEYVRGGDGGYPEGTRGEPNWQNPMYPAGGGGTAIAGGAAGFPSGLNIDWYGIQSSNGTFGAGGFSPFHGGGGGGGYYGGGGAYYAAGGGGSSYAAGTDISSRTGMNVGDGYGIIYWSEGPTAEPSMAPSGLTTAPTMVPSRLPTIMPSNPSRPPTIFPTRMPTQMPSNPTVPPTIMPSNPSAPPTAKPTRTPTTMPSNPSAPPTVRPTNPTAAPTWAPTRDPSCAPTAAPTRPTAAPTTRPSAEPSITPTLNPSNAPTVAPTATPTETPTAVPTCFPTPSPTTVPTFASTSEPTALPTSQPSSRPSCQPSNRPSQQPTSRPSRQPTSQPSRQPTDEPSSQPTRRPSVQPSSQPSAQPSGQPNARPSSQPSGQPSSGPSCQPSIRPSQQPTARPSRQPTSRPSRQPTGKPSSQPTRHPSSQPSAQPSKQPSAQPSAQPTLKPSAQPTRQPSQQPSGQPSARPSMQPSSQPSGQPSSQPSSRPSCQPSNRPSQQPTTRPSAQPTSRPSRQPTGNPSSQPTRHPSAQPSSQPSQQPSGQPSARPTRKPSAQPTRQPSQQPSRQPTARPSVQPTSSPSDQPSRQPSSLPSLQPFGQPSGQPSIQPSTQPSAQPALVPSCQPSTQPSSLPSRQPSTQPSAEPTIRTSGITVRAFAPAPNITELVFTAGRTSIASQVRVGGSAEATIHCGAFAFRRDAAPYLLNSVMGLVLRGAHVVSSGQAAVVSLSDLAPATNYTVYCATQSFDGTLLPLPAVLQTARRVETLCCREVTIDLKSASITEGIAADFAVSVRVNTAPSAPLQIDLYFMDSGGASVNASTVYPASTVFSSNSSGLLSSSHTIIARSLGEQRLVAVLSGASASLYVPVFLSRSRLMVLSEQAPPAVPSLLSAQFRDDGIGVLLKFDSATDRAGYNSVFPCGLLLHFAGAAEAVCNWVDSVTIAIYPQDSGASSAVDKLMVTSPVVLTAGKVRAECTSQNTTWCAAWTAVPEQKVYVATAQNPSVPIVSMTAPASITGCSSLLIDLTSSTGAAGRPWMNVSFTVLTTPSSSKPARVLLSFLQRNYTLSPPLPIPSSALRAGLSYTVQARLCNFLGACGTAARTVFVSQSLVLTPLASTLGQGDREIRRDEELVLSGNCYTESCDRTRSFNGIVRTWVIQDITPGVAGDAQAGLRSVSQNPAVFKLAPYSLRANAIYRVTVNATALSDGQSAVSSAVIRVLQGSLMASIAGNQARSQLSGAPFTIDASGSYDEDYPGQALITPNFRFAWSCIQISPVFRPQCRLNYTQLPGSPVKLSVLGEDTALGSVSRFTMTLSDATRSSSAYVDVTIVAAPLSELSVRSVLSSLTSVDTGDNLALFGSLKLVAPCTARWSVNEPSVNLSTAALTTTTAPLKVEAKPVVFNLVIAGGKLPQRSTLVFTLSCGGAHASLTLTTNGAPLPGLFTIDPPGGEELATLFHFSAEQWRDPDLPLTYQFGFESETSASTLPLRSKSESSYVASNLPAGLAGSDFLLNCTLDVFDSIGASAQAIEPVIVRKGSGGTIDWMEVQQQIEASAGSVDNTKRVLVVTAAVMNSVNCSSAPNCTTLHREKCAATSHACGRCVAGYVGDAGDQNTPCYPSIAAGRRGDAREMNCTSNVDCQPWQICEGGLTRICMAQPKTCLGNCSGHGECVIASTSTGIAVPAAQCRIDNPYCTASCACLGGYSGRMCELSAADVSARSTTRSVLVGAMLNLTLVDDINMHSLESWSAMLHSLALRPYELTSLTVSTLIAMANHTIASARVTQMSPSRLGGVLRALDAVMSVQRSSYNPDWQYANNTVAPTIPLIDAFAQLSSQALVLGQVPSAYVTDNFRVSSALRDLTTEGENITFHILQTAYEYTYPVPPSSIVMIPAAGAATNASSVAVDLITVFPRSYSQDTSMYDADPIYLRVRSDTGENVGAILTSIEFTFVHYETLQRSYEPVENVTSTCVGNSSTTMVTEVCPGSGRVVVHNCTGITGTVESTCPQLMPSCALLSVIDADFTPLSNCILHAYNSTTTVCICPLRTVSGPVPGTRRLSSAAATLSDVIDYTGAANVATISVYTGESFTSTFSAAPEFTTTDALGQVVIVLCLFGTLWGAGLLLAAVSAVHGDPRLYGMLTKKFSNSRMSKIRPAVTESDPKERFLSYIEEVVPQVYSDGKKGLERLLAELCAHHRYLTLFTLGDGKLSYYSKMIIVLKVLTVDTMQMFLLAALYDLQCPDDDGSCVELVTQETCLARKSILDSDQTFCQWSYSPSHSNYMCAYRQPTSSVWTFIYIFVIVSMVTSLFNMPTDYLFAVCTAPVVVSAIGEEAASSVLGRVSFTAGQIARRISKTAAATAQPVTRRVGSIIQKARASIIGADAVIDTESSEGLRQRHASVVQVLPGISHRAKFRESNRTETASLVRAMAIRRHSSLNDRTAKGAVAGKTDYAVDGEDEIRQGEFADGLMDLEAAPVVHTLYTDIIAQRLLLSDSDTTRLFDAQWGVQRVPNTTKQMFEITEAAREAIQTALDESDKIAEEVKEQMPKFTAQHAGLMILHLFIQDLLGRKTSAAKIFNSKFEENYPQIKAVSPWSGVVALCSILLCNAFFAYYALLKAYVKGRTWQRKYVLACVVQMVVEVLLNETLECLWLNYWVPSLVRKDVGSAVRLLKHVAEEITLNDSSAGSATRVFLDAPPYLFASTKVAMKHEKLLESVLVMSYHNHLPGELCKTWPHYEESQLRAESEGESRAPSATLMRVQLVLLQGLVAAVAFMVAMIQWSGTLSFDYQRIIIRIVQPVLFTGLTMLGYFCTANAGALVAFCVAALIVLFVIVVMRRLEDRRAARQLLQVAPVVELDPDLEQEIEQELAVYRATSIKKRGGYEGSSSGSSESLNSCNGETEEPASSAEQPANAVLLSRTSSHDVDPMRPSSPATTVEVIGSLSKELAEVQGHNLSEEIEEEKVEDGLSDNSADHEVVQAQATAATPEMTRSLSQIPTGALDTHPSDEAETAAVVGGTESWEVEAQQLLTLSSAETNSSMRESVPDAQGEGTAVQSAAVAAAVLLTSQEFATSESTATSSNGHLGIPKTIAVAPPVAAVAKHSPRGSFSNAKPSRPAAPTASTPAATPAAAQAGTRKSLPVRGANATGTNQKDKSAL